jgi:hypothetical protein
MMLPAVSYNVNMAHCGTLVVTANVPYNGRSKVGRARSREHQKLAKQPAWHMAHATLTLNTVRNCYREYHLIGISK